MGTGADAVRWPTGTDGSFIAVGANGWLYWHLPGMAPDCRVQVRLLAGGGAEVSALWLAVPTSERLRSSDLRQLPLGTLEAILRNPEIQACLRQTQEPDLAPRGPTSDLEVESWATDLPFAAGTDETPDLRIDPSIWRMKPAFWWAVETLYSQQAQRSHHPARDIAEQNGVKEGTVHRWLWEARRARTMETVEVQR